LEVEVRPKKGCDNGGELNVDFGANASCLGGWYIEPSNCKKPVNNWIVSSDCVKDGTKVTIHTSCSCAVGLCYTYGYDKDDDDLYIIKGYQLSDPNDTTWYFDPDK